MGTGGMAGSFAFFLGAIFFCAGGSSVFLGMWTRGAMRCPTTSTFSFALIVMKLGDSREGCV